MSLAVGVLLAFGVFLAWLGLSIEFGLFLSTVMRKTVHAILGRLDFVVDFRLDDKMIGNWGATVVRLKPGADTTTLY